MYFPTYRMRRMRRTPTLRRMMRETALSPDDLIYPLFVSHGENVKRPIPSMPGCEQLSIGNLLPEVREISGSAFPAVLLFGIPSHKDSAASSAYDPEGVVQLAIRAIKDEVPDLVVITDVCLCEYMDHGHCGVVQDGEIVNDLTLELLAKMAVSHVEAGADIVAPSDMMDGRVAAIRAALDDEGFTDAVDHGRTRRSSPRPSTARSATPPSRRPCSAIARPTRWTRQRRRGRARGAARHRGGRRHRHGQAGAGLPRRRQDGQAGDQVPARRLQRERRVRHDQGGRRQRLARRARLRASRRCCRSSGPAPTSSSPITPKTRCAGCRRSSRRPTRDELSRAPQLHRRTARRAARAGDARSHGHGRRGDRRRRPPGGRRRGPRAAAPAGALDASAPRVVAWEVTRSCNLACAHCRASAANGPYEGELSTAECLELVAQIAAAGKPILILTGGEPLLRPDIFDDRRGRSRRRPAAGDGAQRHARHACRARPA